MLPTYVPASVSTIIPAIIGHFGPHLLVFQTRVLLTELVQVLGHDPRHLKHKGNKAPEYLKQMYAIVQRKLEAKRVDPMKAYLINRSSVTPEAIGAIPPIIIGLGAMPEYKYHPGAPAIVDLNYGSVPLRFLIDGLCRSASSLDLLDAGLISNQNFTVPVTFYAPTKDRGALTVTDFGQMFRDFDLGATISEPHVLVLDNANIYLKLAKHLADNGVLHDHGGICHAGKMPKKDSSSLMTLAVLRRFVVGLTEGTRYQEKDNFYPREEDRNLTSESYVAIAANTEAVLAGLATRMGSVRFKNRDLLHLKSPVWQAIGLLVHDLFFTLHAEQNVIDAVLDRLAALDWSAQSEIAALVKGSGRSNRAAAHAYLRDKTGVAIMLAAATPVAAE